MEKPIRAVYENGLLRPLEPLHVAADHDLLDRELLTSLAGEELSEVTLEAVRDALAKITGDMTAAFVAEREERF